MSVLKGAQPGGPNIRFIHLYTSIAMQNPPAPNDIASTDPDTVAPQDTDQDNGEPAMSEVVMRINLLGKLIIPPAPH